YGDIPWNDLTYFAGVDPATGEAESSNPDEYVIAYGARDSRGYGYVLGVRGSSDWGLLEGTKQLELLNRERSFRRVAVESVSFQVAAKQHIWAETGIPAYKSNTTKSKAVRFETMAGHFEIKRVVIFEKGEGIFGEDEDENFYDQWIDFDEGRHDDRLDSVEKAVEAAMISATVPQEKTDRVREALSKASFG
ncbi:hypothetical protein LCGC14_1512240, partial [marine sediment metagenome]